MKMYHSSLLCLVLCSVVLQFGLVKMKSIAAFALIVAFVVAEPPPSNSYLPPSTRGGYPQSQGGAGAGLPQVVAARSQEQGHGAQGHGSAGGFARNSPAGFGAQNQHQSPNARGARYNQAIDQSQGYQNGYDSNAAGFARNSLDQNADPANYNFGYMVNDHQEGTDFGHHEARQEESAHGEYHVVLPDGRKQTVSYEADERGFKPQISYEDTEDLTRSGGYDSNANNFKSNDHGYHGNEQNGARSNGGQPRSGY